MPNITIVLLYILLPLSGISQILTFVEGTFDFGDVSNIKTVSREIEIMNTGDDILKISQINASCGCTASILEKSELAPNEVSKVTISFDANGRRPGEKEKSITFFSNDRKDPLKEFWFTANVTPIWDVQPRKLIFNAKADQMGLKVQEQTLYIHNMGEKKLEVGKVECNNRNLEITIPENISIKSGEKLPLIVKVKADYIPRYSAAAEIAIFSKIGRQEVNDTILVSLRPFRDAKGLSKN